MTGCPCGMCNPTRNSAFHARPSSPPARMRPAAYSSPAGAHAATVSECAPALLRRGRVKSAPASIACGRRSAWSSNTKGITRRSGRGSNRSRRRWVARRRPCGSGSAKPSATTGSARGLTSSRRSRSPQSRTATKARSSEAPSARATTSFRHEACHTSGRSRSSRSMARRSSGAALLTITGSGLARDIVSLTASSPAVAGAGRLQPRCGQIARPVPCQYRSRRRRFISLPVGARGSSCSKSIERGAL